MRAVGRCSQRERLLSSSRSDRNVVLGSRESGSGGECLRACGWGCSVPAGTVLWKECSFPAACSNLSLINTLGAVVSVACNHTPRCLLLFVLMLQVLKVHKNIRLLYAFYTRKKQI